MMEMIIYLITNFSKKKGEILEEMCLPPLKQSFKFYSLTQGGMCKAKAYI